MRTHRNKLVILAVLAALVLAICPVMVTMAGGTTIDITITAQGSEIDISDNDTVGWDIGTVQQGSSQLYQTGAACTWDLVTNNGSEAVDISIHGHDMTGNAVTWNLVTTAGAAGDFAMKAGLAGQTFYPGIEINEAADSPYELLKGALGSGLTQAFGLKFFAPTSGVGNEAMTMGGAGITLTGTITP